MIAQQEVEVFQFKNQKQAEFHDTVIKSVVRLLNYRYFFYGGAIRGGKALSLSTPLPTPSGWTTMGEIKIGDYVIGQDGFPAKVEFATEIMNDRNCFDVHFSDGSIITCDEEHLWATLTQNERNNKRRHCNEFREKRKKSRPKRGKGLRPDLSERNSNTNSATDFVNPDPRTTKQILQTIDEKHSIDTNAGFNLPEQKFIINPYLLGVWLGDGFSGSSYICGAKVDLLEIEKYINEDGDETVFKELPDVCIISIRRLITRIRQLGLYKNKHIPIEYLRASFSQRLSILQGIIDTDGTVDNRGHIEITLSNERLCYGVLELIRTMGIKATIRKSDAILNGKKVNDRWRIAFITKIKVARLKRKADKIRGKNEIRPFYIEKIIPTRSVPVRCIQVERCMYLCGNAMIPTHNTFICLFLFLTFARMFPRSRWHIFRSDFPELEDTTIPSMEKLIGTEGKDFVWKKSKSNYHVLFENGSKIFFKSENIDRDPELNWMLGLETNGIFLEQMEGLSEKLFSRAMERAGSWVIPDMPPPIILGTFNPTNTWVKKLIYDRFFKNELPDDWYFEEALPSDNPFVTEDQWKNWENLDDVSYNQLIKGIWRFLTDAKLFAYSFDRAKHVVNVETEEGKALMQPKRSLPLRVIFDFNVDPITALIAQTDGLTWCKVFAEYRLRNSDIFELTERVKNDWGMYFIVVTGDASGRARSALTKGNRSYVDTIKTELRLSSNQLQFPTKNPSVANTRILMNSIFKKHPSFLISSACLYLIDDLESVVVDNEGDIDKKKDSTKTHLLDNLRYLMWNYLRAFLNVKL